MPTCRDIIERAFRKMRTYGTGETPSAADMADGLDELQSLYETWAANGMFGSLADVETDVDYDAGQNERIRVTDNATVTIPTSFDEGGDSFPPYDMAFIEVVDTVLETVTRYLFDASQGAWVEIGALTLDSEAPLASKGRSGLSACLALALAEEYGAQIGPAVLGQARAFKMGLSLKFGGDAQRTAPDYL